MARRGMWLIGGVAVGVSALVLKGDSRTWLRRRLGMEPEDRRWFEEEDVEPAEHEGDEPLDTREARFSLRARLAEEAGAEQAPERPPLAAAPPLAPVESTPAPLDPAFGSTPPVTAPEPEPQPQPQSQPLAAAPEPQPLAAAPEPDEEAEEAQAPLAAAWEPEPEPDETVLAPLAAAPEPVEEAPRAPAWADAPASAAASDESAPAPENAAADEDEDDADETPAATPWVTAAPDLAPVADLAPEAEPAPDTAPATPARAFESVPQIGPEDDAPKTPGEDTSEIEAVPSIEAWQAPPAAPPIPLRPPSAPAAPPSRPFSESTSFRSAIDAARERVHGAAREATPDDEGESTEPRQEREGE